MYLYIKKVQYSPVHFYEKGAPTGLYPEELRGFEEKILKRNFASVETTELCQVGYWRKANAIHDWFVKHCADGVDDCREMPVSISQLEELLNDCKKALKSKGQASNILPTSSGFFFGSTDYDDWYFDNLEYTVELLTDVIKFITEHRTNDYKWPDYLVVYQASW